MFNYKLWILTFVNIRPSLFSLLYWMVSQLCLKLTELQLMQLPCCNIKYNINIKQIN